MFPQTRPEFFDLSWRLRKLLFYKSDVFYGYQTFEQGGHWQIILVKNIDVYKYLDIGLLLG